MSNKGFLYNTLNAIEENIFGVIIGAVILGSVGTWTHQMYSTYRQTEIENKKLEVGLELKVGDFNGNETLDKFYEIEGQKVPVEVDGKSVNKYFKQ